jgi:rSAM/selenodomain-associated transferase 1
MYHPQVGGDLGARMFAAFTETKKMGFTQTVLVGTDCPPLHAHHLRDAFRALRRNEVVLGPTPDGGYYLVGARNPPANMFADISWSTSCVLEQTLQVLGKTRIQAALLTPLRDLDDADDLRYHMAEGNLALPPV